MVMIQATFMALLLASAEGAAARGSSHATLLLQMPAELLDAAGGSYPDAEGLVGHNRGGFKAAALQRGAMLKLAIAAARGDKKRADDCWRAIDVTFQRQHGEGHFGDPPASVAFWLCELNRTLLVVRQSPLADHYEARMNALLPKIRKASEWLATKKETLFKEDGHAPNRLFFDACAFGFAGILLGDEGLTTTGREFLARGMRLFRDEDGAFLERGGGDSSYQAVCLLRLQEWVLHFPDARTEAAIDRGMQWELGKIGPDGTITTEGNTRVRPGGEKFMGNEKQVNVGEVCLALLYYHARTGDAASLDAARRIYDRHRRGPVPPDVRRK